MEQPHLADVGFKRTASEQKRTKENERKTDKDKKTTHTRTHAPSVRPRVSTEKFEQRKQIVAGIVQRRACAYIHMSVGHFCRRYRALW